MNRNKYYDEMYLKGKGKEWDKAPGKEVIVNAFKGIVLPNLSEALYILDIGCGTGYLLSRIYNITQSKTAHLIGIDISSVAIKIAKKRYEQLGIVFKIEDGCSINLENESVDVAISYGTFEHFDNPDLGIKEMSRILKCGGYFLTMIPALGHYRKDREDEGWYPDKTGQLQWNLFRKTWEDFFVKSKLLLFPMESAKKYGAINPGVFFFGMKKCK